MKILFVCTGNTCRSPFAAGYLNHLNLPDITALSVGLQAGGQPVSAYSAAVAKEYGFSIDSHISALIGAKAVCDADIIFCMNDFAKKILAQAFPNLDIRVLGGGIPDPYGGTLESYREMAAAVIKAIREEFIKLSFADKSDIPAIAALEKECFSAPWSENAIEESLSHGTLFFKAEVMGKTVGYMGISRVLDEGYITNIAVSAPFRGRGIAKELLLFAEAELSALSFISLEVRQSNTAAIALYERLGYKKAGLRKNFYSKPTENALIYTKEF